MNKIVIFGTGLFLNNRINEFDLNEVVAFVDNDFKKWGLNFWGRTIHNPQDINTFEYDYVVVMGNDTNAEQMKRDLYRIGVKVDKILDYSQYIDNKKNSTKRRILVWGTGVFCKNRIRIFEDDNVIAYVDNNKSKQGECFNQRLIIDTTDAEALEYDYLVVMLNPRNSKEVYNQIRGLSIPENKVVGFSQYLGITAKNVTQIFCQSKNDLNFFENNIQPGLSLHKSINNINVKPLISIVTPFYNAGRYFEQTFNCVMNQTFPWFEWIIVDDGSTNGDDLKILNNYSSLDNRIVVYHTNNQKQAAARNYGIERCTTDIVVMLDADDLISEQYLEYCYWGLYFNKDADWAYTWSVGFQNNMYLWKKPFNAEEIKQNNTLVLTSAIRKSLWEQVGGFKKEEIAYNEDWRFWLDCLSLSKKPVCLAGYHFWYRRTDEGMLNTLKNDDIRVYLSDRITENAAKTVDKNVRAKHYPINSCDNLYSFNDNTEWALEYTVEKNNNIRMLWIVPWVVMGGADKFNIDAAKGLSERGYDISIMTTIPSDNEWLYKCKEFTDEIFCLPDFIDETNYLSFVDYYIKSRQIDILMVTNSTVGYYMVPYIRQKYPKMVIVDYVHMEEWYWKAGGHARTSSRLSDITDMTFVCNSATERVMIDQLGHPAESINTLHIGVDSDTFYKDIVEEGFLYRLAQLDENRPIVLFPCRIHPQKRPFMVIDIAKKASSIVPNIAFVVVGDGPQLEELKQTIKKNGLEHTIICIGATDRMAECYKDAKLTLICSLKEGLALTAYESCSMGVPVISSDVGGQGDLIDWEVGALISLCQDEETSLDCREYNESEVDEYAKAICDYLQDDKRYKSAAKKCRERIVNDFSVNRMVEKLDNNLTNLVKSTEQINKRKDISCALKLLGNVSKELYNLSVAIDVIERN